MVLKIKCKKCSGPMWEEDLRDSRTYIDLACLYCGHRIFVERKKYNDIKKQLDRSHKSGQRITPTRGALLTSG